MVLYNCRAYKMNLRSQKVQTQTIADRVKMNPRAAAKDANEVLTTNKVQEEKSEVKEKVVKQAVGRVCHRYMLRSMRR